MVSVRYKRSSTDWRPLNIAVVDEGANLILFNAKMDRSALESCINKAKSSVLIHITKIIEEIIYGTADSPPRVPGLNN